MLSIIIPTLNEEKYLPKLLESIRLQDNKNYEIIVADGNSKDETVKIAKRFGCRVLVNKNRSSPSIQRNAGAKIANGDILLFLDADVRIGKNFVRRLLTGISDKKLDAGSCYSETYDGKPIDRFIYNCQNVLMSMVSKIWAHGYGFCIFAKRDVFLVMKGFNEEIYLGEDNDFAKRSSRKFRYGILHNPKVSTSSRRWQIEGRLNLFWKYLVSQFYRMFIGEIKGKKFKYDFDYEK